MLDIRKIFSIGQNSIIRHVVQKSDTAGNYSKELNELLATPACIGMVIKAAVETVDPYLPEGFISICLLYTSQKLLLFDNNAL